MLVTGMKIKKHTTKERPKIRTHGNRCHLYDTRHDVSTNARRQVHEREQLETPFTFQEEADTNLNEQVHHQVYDACVIEQRREETPHLVIIPNERTCLGT